MARLCLSAAATWSFTGPEPVSRHCYIFFQRHMGRMACAHSTPPPPALKSVLESANSRMDSECTSGCTWSTARATAPSPGQPTPGVVKQDKSSGGSVDTTKTRSGPQRVRMSSGERPIGAAKGKQSDTEALCQPPPRTQHSPPPPPTLPPPGGLQGAAVSVIISGKPHQPQDLPRRSCPGRGSGGPALTSQGGTMSQTVHHCQCDSGRTAATPVTGPGQGDRQRWCESPEPRGGHPEMP